MYTRLLSYLYAIFIVCVSSSSFALTPEEQAFGGFATATVCSHPSDLNFCVDSSLSEAKKQACMIWMSSMQAGQTGSSARQYTFRTITNDTCVYDYTVTSTGSTGVNTQPLTNRTAMCPVEQNPSPKQITFSRQGRWFSQELESTRCFEKCEYSTTSSNFSYKHYSFTNGIVTYFSENMNNRATSNAKFCFAPVEPVRSSDGEVTYESNCQDAVFTQICDFINWFRNDSEMPEAEPVKHTELSLGTTLRKDIIVLESEACFPDYQFTMRLDFINKTLDEKISFTAFCNTVYNFQNLLYILYLLHAGLILFRSL